MSTLAKRRVEFLVFHGDHPEVYLALVERIRQLRSRGHHSRYGMRALWQWLRWETKLPAYQDRHKIEAMYLLNDHHTPFYARLLMDRHDAPAGYFELRGLK